MYRVQHMEVRFVLQHQTYVIFATAVIHHARMSLARFTAEQSVRHLLGVITVEEIMLHVPMFRVKHMAELFVRLILETYATYATVTMQHALIYRVKHMDILPIRILLHAHTIIPPTPIQDHVHIIIQHTATPDPARRHLQHILIIQIANIITLLTPIHRFA